MSKLGKKLLQGANEALEHYQGKRQLESYTVEQGSGNVFEDIGMKNPEVALVKAELARRINLDLDTRRALNWQDEVKLLGIPRSLISDLTLGRLSSFSLEKMIDLATRVGFGVELRIRRSKTPRFMMHRDKDIR